LLSFLQKHRYALVYIPLIIYWIILLAATSFPSERLPTLGVGDKSKHFFAYFILAFLLNLTLLIQDKYPKMKEKAGAYTWVIIAIYGILDELHQMLIPGRSAELLDWIADILGALAGVIAVYFISRQSKQADTSP
jgi:VanZ family protein